MNHNNNNLYQGLIQTKTIINLVIWPMRTINKSQGSSDRYQGTTFPSINGKIFKCYFSGVWG